MENRKKAIKVNQWMKDELKTEVKKNERRVKKE